MGNINTDHLSDFGRLAIKLDTDFSEMARIGGQLERMDIDSDSGLEHALKLLEKFAQHGLSIAEGIQAFSQSLLDAKAKSEAATRFVSDFSQTIQKRKQQQNDTRHKLTHLEEQIRDANANLAGFKDRTSAPFTAEDKHHLTTELELLNSRLGGFIERAQAIKDEASQSNFKSVAKDAQVMVETLQSSRRKLSKALGNSH